MRIGIDIDGVINNLEQFHLECGTKFCYEHRLVCQPNPAAYEVRDVYGWTDAEYRHFQKEYYQTFFLTSAYVRPFASEVLHILRKSNEIYIITARKPRLPTILGLPTSDSVSGLTTRWLAQVGIEYDQFFLTGCDKREVLYQNKIDIILEDSPDFFSLALDNHCAQMICFDADYNRGVSEQSILRAFSWYDALQLIQKKESSL